MVTDLFIYVPYECKVHSFYLPLPSVYRTLFGLSSDSEIIKVTTRKVSPFFSPRSFING